MRVLVNTMVGGGHLFVDPCLPGPRPIQPPAAEPGPLHFACCLQLQIPASH